MIIDQSRIVFQSFPAPWLVLGKSEAGYKAGWGGGKRGRVLEKNRESGSPSNATWQSRISEYIPVIIHEILKWR